MDQSVGPIVFPRLADRIHQQCADSPTKHTVVHPHGQTRLPTQLSDAVFRRGVWKPADDQRSTSTPLGYGGVYLAKWLRLLRHNKLLAADALTQVKVP